MNEIYAQAELTERDVSIDHFIPWSYVAHDELWNLHPTTRAINASKSNKLPDWNKYFPRFCEQEYFSYQMIWKYDKVHEEFQKCAEEHLNNQEVQRRLYREGMNYQEFRNGLSEVMLPVYQAAKNCGFMNWVFRI